LFVRDAEADLSVLWPFTAEQIREYVEYLRREGATTVAAATERAADRWLAAERPDRAGSA
jgi:hypothetical protein